MQNKTRPNYMRLPRLILFGLWAADFIYVLMINPSSNESKNRLKEMQGDFSVLLPNEGSILYRQDLAKNGGALLLRGLSAAAWTPQFKSGFYDTLAKLDWRRNQKNGIYCKNDMSITTYDHLIDYQGKQIDVIDITMDYSALSKRRCE